LSDTSDQNHHQADNPTPRPIGPAEDTNPKPPEKKHGAHKRKHTWLEKFAVFFAGLAFIAAYWQGWVARDTEKRQLRAYISVKEITLNCPLCLDKNWKPPEGPRLHNIDTTNAVVVTVKNSGITPAYNVRFYPTPVIRLKDPNLFDENGSCPRTPFRRVPVPGFDDLLPSPTIGSQATAKLYDPHTTSAIATSSPDQWFVLCGWVYYSDIFDERWHTSLCYFVETVVTDEKNRFTECPHGHNPNEPSDVPLIPIEEIFRRPPGIPFPQVEVPPPK